MKQKKYAFIALTAILVVLVFADRNISFLKNQSRSLLALVSGAPSFSVGAPAGNTNMDVPISGSDTVPVSSDTSTTGSGTTADNASTPLAVTLTANGQTKLDLPLTSLVSGQVPPQTAVDIVWSVNHSDAKCTAGEMYPGSEMLSWYGDLSGSSGDTKVYVPDEDKSWTMNLRCTWQGQTVDKAAQITVGGGGGSDGEVTFVAKPVNFFANGQTGSLTVSPGTSVLLAWDGGNVLECKGSGSWGGNLAASGQQSTGPLYSNASYTLTCGYQSNELPPVSRSITVYVSGGDTSSTQTSNTQPPCEPPNPNKLQVASRVCHPTPTPQPTTDTYTPPTSTITQISCDQTAQAVVTAAGGCSNISASSYPNVYNACCTVVTKSTLLKALNDALVNGMTQNDKANLLNLLNKYLSL